MLECVTNYYLLLLNACATDWVTDNDDMYTHSLANHCISDQYPVIAEACPADLKSAIKKYEPCAGRMLNPIFCSLPAKYFRFCSRECPKDLNNRGSRVCLLPEHFRLRESVHERPISTSLVCSTLQFSQQLLQPAASQSMILSREAKMTFWAGFT